MTNFNNLIKIHYFPFATAGQTAGGDAEQGGRNPFVKIGDQIKLHSRHGTYRVLEITDGYFRVSVVRSGWLIRNSHEYKCAWNDFRCWSRKN